MVSPQARELLREDARLRGGKLSPLEREKLLKPYLPDPSDLKPRTSSSQRRHSRKKPIRGFVKSKVHHLTYALAHIIFGIVMRLLQAYHAVVDRIFAIVYHHHRTPELIRKDVRGLKRLPQHLSVILSLHPHEDGLAVLMDEVAELAAWSACAGIPQLSIYERTGALKSGIPALHQIITTKMASYYGSPLQQPVLRVYAPHHPAHGSTPSSRPENPSLNILLLSSTDGRETIVDLTKTLAEMSQNGKLSPEDITQELIDAEISDITSQPLQDSVGRDTSKLLNPEPDLLLVFGSHLRLNGYPPWQLRLTEMYCTGDHSHGMTGYGEAVEYQGFMRGLWHYAGAEMRFGR